MKRKRKFRMNDSGFLQQIFLPQRTLASQVGIKKALACLKIANSKQSGVIRIYKSKGV
jgi:hypothetical protein